MYEIEGKKIKIISVWRYPGKSKIGKLQFQKIF
jgi:hypothetical protein